MRRFYSVDRLDPNLYRLGIKTNRIYATIAIVHAAQAVEETARLEG